MKRMADQSIVPYDADNHNDLQQINEYKLEIVEEDSTKKSTKKRKVLTEDEYRQNMSSIIERDFFPDLPKLRLDLQLQDATQNNDFERISQLARKKIELQNESADSEELNDELPMQKIDPREPEQEESSVKTVPDSKNLSLNKFLNKYTSEDNESFNHLQSKTMQKHLNKMKSLYNDSIESNNEIVEKSLQLPSIEQQQMLKNTDTDSNSNRLITWKYSDKNSVMFDPEGLALSKDELEARNKQSKQMIIHDNTRFKIDPFKSNVKCQSSSNISKPGKIGVDGKELMNGSQTPSVNGFSFVPSTPCIKPGENNSPLMTWGVIDATPINLRDEQQTPRTDLSGSTHFRFAKISEKEAIGQQLAEQISLKKKAAAAAKAKNPIESPLIMGQKSSTNLERLNSMSPAARLLAMNKLGVNQMMDNRLQASYSPLMRTSQLTTPTPRRSVTPSPLTLGSSSKVMTPKTSGNNGQTDLKKVKRANASQFF